MSIEHDIADLASHVAKKAAQDTTTLQESTDALKALTTYYGMLKKHGPEEDEEAEPSLASLTASIAEQTIAEAPVRGRRGRGRTQ